MGVGGQGANHQPCHLSVLLSTSQFEAPIERQSTAFFTHHHIQTTSSFHSSNFAVRWSSTSRFIRFLKAAHITRHYPRENFVPNHCTRFGRPSVLLGKSFYTPTWRPRIGWKYRKCSLLFHMLVKKADIKRETELCLCQLCWIALSIQHGIYLISFDLQVQFNYRAGNGAAMTKIHWGPTWRKIK